MHAAHDGRLRAILILLAGLAWGTWLAASAAQAAPPETKGSPPNFVIILADDLGFSDLGCYGGEIATPHLDRLAAGGLRFTQFYNTARCWPTRSSLMTGYYAQQIRMDPPKGRLPAWSRLLPHYLKPLGYRAYHSGKWHVNGAPKPVLDGGFDRSYVIHDHDRFFHPQRANLDDKPVPAVPKGSDFYLTRHIADRAIEFLTEHQTSHADTPFLLYLAFTCPHFPLHALDEDIHRYRDKYLEGWDVVRRRRWERQRELGFPETELSKLEPETIPSWNLPAEQLTARIGAGEVARAVAWDTLTDEQRKFQATNMAIHAAMIDRMDQEIGRVLDQLRAMQVFDNTVIFFLSDNGASAEQIIRGDQHDPQAALGSADSYLCLGPGWSTCANTPFRRHKYWTHEGGVATPCIVHWPAGIPKAGEWRHDVGHVVDLAPTLLELGGTTLIAARRGVGGPVFPGHSLVPTWARDGSLSREFVFFHHQGNRGLRMGDWKIVSSVQSQDRWELYNLAQDRTESHDLSRSEAEHPRLEAMQARWQDLEIQFRRDADSP